MNEAYETELAIADDAAVPPAMPLSTGQSRARMRKLRDEHTEATLRDLRQADAIRRSEAARTADELAQMLVAVAELVRLCGRKAQRGTMRGALFDLMFESIRSATVTMSRIICTCLEFRE